MTIDLTDIIKNFGEKRAVCGEVEINGLEFFGEELVASEPFKAVGHIMNNSKTLSLELEVSGVLTVSCARCLSPVKVEMSFPVRELLVREEDDIEEGEVTEDVLTYTGHTFCPDEAVRDNLLMNLGVRYLCSEDCKGLCKVCGKNLNEGDCDCQKEDIDPRWSALLDIMNKDTE